MHELRLLVISRVLVQIPTWPYVIGRDADRPAVLCTVSGVIQDKYSLSSLKPNWTAMPPRDATRDMLLAQTEKGAWGGLPNLPFFHSRAMHEPGMPADGWA